jgi:D-beta-D-heptose 7-phosphate kinase/D-beta-D-heptose 1-phosphate adenosyltransferase
MTALNTQPQKRFNVLLIGDTCVDEYQYGVVERISPEAPVPIFKLTSRESKMGMASNVYQNLKNLNCDVTCYYGKSSFKTRLIDRRSKQHLIRIDDDVESKPFDPYTVDNLEDYDAIVISDYNKGFVTHSVITNLRDRFTGPIFLDTKKTNLSLFNGIFVKINELEYKNCTSYNSTLIVTLGDKGAMYQHPNGDEFFSCSDVEVSDVTGAGDTFLAALTYKYLCTNVIQESIKFAIQASGITVKHFGVYAPTLKEIE